MRVGVDYRFLGVGPDLITRGICRFTQQQMREVLRRDADEEFVLLCNEGDGLGLIAPDVFAPDNVRIAVYAFPRHLERGFGRTADSLELAEDYQAWVHAQELDVYHATSPFFMSQPSLVRFDVCPVVSTFYDVIPKLFPAEYHLDDPEFGGEYRRALGLAQASDRLLAISDCARDDAVAHLGMPRERIDRAWPIPDEVFQPLPPGTLRKLLVVLTSRVRLPERYVLTVSALHHAKNLATLLEGYARLPERTRATYPLVICCHLDPDSERAARRLAGDLGAGDDIVVTGHVSDLELCAIYNGAALVVHPSRYEGFGLPVVEAMRCGAPVVTTTASSLPEVAGDAAVLVDPEDPAAFVEAIASVLADAGLREAMRERGFEQSRRFGADQLAEGTLASYRRTVEQASQPGGGERLRLAVWTPLPPQGSGIADYAAELLEGLAPHCETEVFVDGGYAPEDDMVRRHRVHHHSAFARRAAQQPFDAVVYQVGASAFHDYMDAALASHPGIVTLHDLAWSPVVYDRSYRNGQPEAFHRALAATHGRAAVDELLELEASGRTDLLWDFLVRHPMLELVLDRSLAQVVLLRSMADELRAGHPGTDPWYVPMGVADPYERNPGLSLPTARCQLGLDPSAFVAGIFGIVHPVKRLDVCIRAFAANALRRPSVLAVVGRALDEGYVAELRGLADQLGVGERVLFTGHVPAHVFNAHLVASDVVVNLRAPTHKHMSATIMRGVAAGRPILMSDLADWRFIPDACCRRILPDEREEPALAAALGALAEDEEERLRMGAAARAWYEREGTVEAMAQRYLEVVRRVVAGRAPACVPA